MKLIRRYSGILILLLLIGIPAFAQDDTVAIGDFSPVDCRFEQTTYRYTCGYVTVPENHLLDNGETIELAVTIIHSNNENAQPDPVLYLSGGPGGAYSGTANTVPRSFHLAILLTERDLIVVDQRGMGSSKPAYNCIPFTDANDAFNLSIEAYQERMAACPEQFAEQGIDWQAYTTEQNAADLAMIPAALGYNTYNIFGHSYGTILGQIILRDHDDAVRAAILDSVVAINANSFEETALNNAAQFAQIQAACHADALCRWAYPDLEEQFVTVYERLTADPVFLTINGVEFAINGRTFADFITLNLSSRSRISTLPSIITAFYHNDFDTVSDFLREVASAPVEDYPNQALLMTMICPHNAPYTSPEQIESVQADIPEPFRIVGLNSTTWQMCQSWEDIPTGNIDLAASDVPTLLTGGQYDAVTPARWASQAAQNLTNATVITVPYTGHITNEAACVQRLTRDFFDAPDQPLNTDCLDDIDDVSFVLHTTVTRPPIQIGAVLFGVISVVAIGLMLFSGLRDIRRTAWIIAFKKQGWLPLAVLIFVIYLVYSRANAFPDDLTNVGVVQAIVPLFMGIQLASIFSPSDEPALEVQIAAGRSVIWLVAERVVVVVLTYTLIAAAGIGISLAIVPDQNLAVVLLGWLPSGLFLGGIGFYISVRSRMVALGALTAGLLWIVFGLFAQFLIPGQLFPPPMNAIQPFLWSIHVHASLEHLVEADYWLNRAFLATSGISLLFAAAWQLRDIERLLLGVRSKSGQSAAKNDDPVKRTLSPSGIVTPVTTQIDYLNQLWGIMIYSARMQLRTRGFKVFVIVPVAMYLVLLAIMGGVDFMPGYEAATNADIGQFRLVLGEIMVMMVGSIFFVPAAFLYPVLVADTFSTDHRLHVDEVLNGLPQPVWVMLIGRVLGVTLVGAAGLISSFGAVILIAVIANGRFNLSPVTDMITGFILLQCLLTATVLLLCSTQKSGRLATGLAILYTVLPDMLQRVPLIADLFPSKSALYVHYATASSSSTTELFEIQVRAWETLSPGIAQPLAIFTAHLAVAFAIALMWRVYHQNKE